MFENIEILEGEIVENDVYTGIIASSHENYAFINNVKRGYETINTNGDVFVPGNFLEGAVVEFEELNIDPERSTEEVRRFRTEKAKIMEYSLAEAERDPLAQRKMLALKQLMTRETYLPGEKRINPEEVKKALKNRPFIGMLENVVTVIVQTEGQMGPEVIKRATEQFLAEKFASLGSFGISFSLSKNEEEIEAENKKIADTLIQYSENNLHGQKSSLNQEYTIFSKVSNVLRLMDKEGVLGLDSIIPKKHLVDLLVMYPVWYLSSNNFEDKLNDSDPTVSKMAKFICNMLGSENAAMLYQIYNRRDRGLQYFDSKDLMGPKILGLLKEVKKIADLTVIATPYHGKASQEWQDPNWLQNIDPSLVVFIEGFDGAIKVTKWSATGLFPTMGDMIADTIDHLRLNGHHLKNFLSNTYWYHLNNINEPIILQYNDAPDDSSNSILPQFAQALRQAYEEETLFEFLHQDTFVPPAEPHTEYRV